MSRTDGIFVVGSMMMVVGITTLVFVLLSIQEQEAVNTIVEKLSTSPTPPMQAIPSTPSNIRVKEIQIQEVRYDDIQLLFEIVGVAPDPAKAVVVDYVVGKRDEGGVKLENSSFGLFPDDDSSFTFSLVIDETVQTGEFYLKQHTADAYVRYDFRTQTRRD